MKGSQRPWVLLLDWYQGAKRDLPWRKTRDPYRIWISEIMLQQTRVETVKGYYQRFLQLFPQVEALAAAPQEQVLKAWEGLGYYSRARNLQQAARDICETLQGRFPQSYEGLLGLRGIGPYTAGAIASIAFGQRVPAVDGNVLRVASRYFGIRQDVGIPSVQRALRQRVLDSMPPEGTCAGEYNQALMELGATVCIPGRPRCPICPWSAECDAYAQEDAHQLPIHEKKAPPKEVDIGVCLLTWRGRVLVMRRSQRLLKGLYVFYLAEGVTEHTRAAELLKEQGLDGDFIEGLGEARHVFTHRVWNMAVWHFTLRQKPTLGLLQAMDAQMVDRAALEALPLPAAMKAAKEKALSLLM